MGTFDANHVPDTVTITRVKNGFSLTTPDYCRQQGMMMTDQRVFNDLGELFDFLTEKGFDCTEEVHASK